MCVVALTRNHVDPAAYRLTHRGARRTPSPEVQECLSGSGEGKLATCKRLPTDGDRVVSLRSPLARCRTPTAMRGVPKV